ncbi:protein kinase domain-containing protein [Kitasatospora sp. NPDC004240]
MDDRKQQQGDTTPEIEDERPWELPDYLHERELGAGASGRVVLARHRATGTPVAIKYLHSSVGTAGLREEAEVLAGIDSPHVTRLYEYVEGERGSAIVMELVDGVALRTLLKEEGATTPEAALVVLKGSLLGLAAAHAAGVVHRDYKPGNVLVDTAGTSKLVDFGIAVPSGDGGDVSGTPAYMAPEQWAGKPASPTADVYAATVTFFECLTGARPYDGATLAELAVQHTEAPIPAELAPDPVRPLILAGLAKDPQARPDSAAVLVEELEAVATAGYGSDWEEKGRRDLLALLALLALLLPGGGGAGDGGTTLAHTAVPDPGAPADSAGPMATEAFPAAVPVRYTESRPGPRLGRRGKVLAGVGAGVVTLATVAGMAMAGAADGGARTVLGGASPTATTTLGSAGPTDGTSPTATGDPGTPSPGATGTESPTASPSASSGSPSTPGAATPTGKGPVPPGMPPSGGAAPTTGLPPAPPVTVAPVATTPAPTTPPPIRPTIIFPPLAVTSATVTGLSCSGRWSLTATISVKTTGIGAGTLSVSWFHSGPTGGAVTVATSSVPITSSTTSVTVSHDFGSADTFPTWGASVTTGAGKSSKSVAAYLCDPPR